MGSISLRVHIRWPPAPAEEPTSTLVLTSPGRCFVDLRIFQPTRSQGDGNSSSSKDDQDDEKDGEPVQEIDLPISSLDWAIAGTSASYDRDVAGQTVSHSCWTHWIDSRTRNDPESTVTDEGDMYPQPNGTTLEKGTMLNPATGVRAEYEELWKDMEPLPLGGPAAATAATAAAAARCVVLQLDDPGHEARGMIVLLGQFCQGLLRVGDSVAAQRWGWREESGWRVEKSIGGVPPLSLPCDRVFGQLPSLTVGSALQDGDFVWRVVESVERSN